MVPRMPGSERNTRSTGSSKKFEWSMSPWPIAGCIVCIRPAVPPSKAIRMSPAQRHNNDCGPSAMRVVWLTKGRCAECKRRAPRVAGRW